MSRTGAREGQVGGTVYSKRSRVLAKYLRDAQLQHPPGLLPLGILRDQRGFNSQMKMYRLQREGAQRPVTVAMRKSAEGRGRCAENS